MTVVLDESVDYRLQVFEIDECVENILSGLVFIVVLVLGQVVFQLNFCLAVGHRSGACDKISDENKAGMC